MGNSADLAVVLGRDVRDWNDDVARIVFDFESQSALSFTLCYFTFLISSVHVFVHLPHCYLALAIRLYSLMILQQNFRD